VEQVRQEVASDAAVDDGDFKVRYKNPIEDYSDLTKLQ